MKKMLLCLFGAGIAFSACAADVVTLPESTLDTPMTLRQAMRERKTIRDFAPVAPAKKMQYISDLLWCATGQNRPDGHRVTPAAINLYAATLYVADADAVYRFDRQKNTLTEVARGNYMTACASNRKMCELATFALIFVLDESVWAERNRQDYAALEVGAMMQNVYLGCAALDLGTCACGSFNAEKLAAALPLAAHQKIYLTMVVGGKTR